MRVDDARSDEGSKKGAGGGPDGVASPLSIRLFGPFEVRLGGQPLPHLRFRKSQAILAMLILRQGGEVERDWLAGLLWPDGAPARGRHTLRNCLSDLRSALGPEAGRLRSPTSRTLTLNLTDATVDVLAFDAALARGDPDSLAAAMTLYRGPLLEGCAEEWAFQERQGREQAYLQALEKLAGLAQARGEAAEAERYLRLAVAADPLRESAQRSLMEVLAAGGNYAAALLAYRELRLRLHREVNAEPDPETRALFQHLRQKARERAGTRSTPSADTRTSDASDITVNVARMSLTMPSRRLDNLPAPTTALLGREEAVMELVRWLQRKAVRLVTLTGPGGSGKTRLGLQVADELLDQFSAGVFLVELAPLRDPHLVSMAIAQVLGVRETGSQPLAEALKEHLRNKDLLLVLDNFEQLLPAAPLVAELLAAAPGLKVLVTSRASLQLRGEKEYPVPPLAVPGAVDSGQRMAVRSGQADAVPLTTIHPPLSTVPSVQLFLQRAQDVCPDFGITPANAAAVAEICCRLDGLPLAIELAAARVRALTPQEMLAHLRAGGPQRGPGPVLGAKRAGAHEVGGRFELLVGRRHDAAPRHRSLRATLDWSYQLLSPELQQFFARLSVFRGGWSLEAAAAISDFGFPISDCGTGANAGVIQGPHSKVRYEKTLKYLEELQQCSLVVTEALSEKMCYRLLETVREYGAEQLTAEEGTALAQRHLDYYRAWIEKDLPGVGGRTLPQKLEKIEREPDNLRTALDWWVQSGAARDWVLQTEDRAFQFLHTLTYFWLVRGYTLEGRQRLAQILALPGAAVRTMNRAYVLLMSGELARQQADFGAADALIRECLAINQELGSQPGELGCYRTLADLARDQGDYERARPFNERRLELARKLGNERETASALTGMGYVAYLEGDLGTAQSLMEQSLQKLREGQEVAWTRAHPGEEADNPYDYSASVGRLMELAWACEHRGEVADARGEYGTALACLEESVAIFREYGFLRHAFQALYKLGRVARHEGRWSEATTHFCESLAFWWQDGDKQRLAACLDGLAAVAGGQGEPERAARLLGAAAALRESRGIPLPSIERADLDQVLAAVRAGLSEEAFGAAWACGQSAPLEEVIAQALQEAPAG